MKLLNLLVMLEWYGQWNSSAFIGRLWDKRHYKDKIFKEKYYNHLYENAWAENCLNILQEYEKGAKELDRKGELFFMGIWNFIDEYIREYTPSDAPYFNSETDVDEKKLQEKTQAAFDILARNQERWANNQDESIKI